MRYKRFLKHKGFLGTDDKGSCFCSSHFLSSNHYFGVKENRNLANRRRRRQKPNQMVWIMLAITMVCVVIVFAIVMVQKEKGTLVKQARAVTKDMVYENAYIMSNDDGRLIFICDGDLYRAKGTMEENFTGVSDIVISHQLFAEEAGGAFPRWVMANIETGVMQGDPTPILISNAYAFGARNYDPKPIFKTMRKGAEEPGAMSQEVEARPGLKQYLDKGYYNASIQLEYTSADFAIAQFALHAVGDEFASWRYFHFARSWKNLYNPETGWLQSRNPDGSWKPLTEDFRESTYKNYFWMVPYDIAGLIEIIGGKAAAEKRLDEFFTRLDAGYNDAWFASGNEPSFHIPWIYNWVGTPYKAQEIINRVLNEQYSSKIDGLPGNDDLGTMGAWYVFACIGLYPEIPGVGGFTVNTPIFSSVKVHLKKGDMVIKGGSEKNIYIKSMKLNGKPYDSTWIDWDQLNNGATIEYTTSSKPDVKWGTKVTPPSFP